MDKPLKPVQEDILARLFREAKLVHEASRLIRRWSLNGRVIRNARDVWELTKGPEALIVISDRIGVFTWYTLTPHGKEIASSLALDVPLTLTVEDAYLRLKRHQLSDCVLFMVDVAFEITSIQQSNSTDYIVLSHIQPTGQPVKNNDLVEAFDRSTIGTLEEV